jgi:hypothetical protein
MTTTTTTTTTTTPLTFLLVYRGALTMKSTVTPMLSANYRGNSCGNHDMLDNLSGRATDGFDAMGKAAANARGFNVNRFDFSVVFIPRCSAIGFSGNDLLFLLLFFCSLFSGALLLVTSA